ncbi:DDE-type integrase/transposase/recombinase [Kitasatospora sp. NPDC058406]|uniref:DDE-type integrase/transposase/recombinase n=1 Tax=Kitasatospora sp. NPDC058406 TaxID=3346483 RepID=UPI003668D7DB
MSWLAFRGWSVSFHMRTRPVADALAAAVATRGDQVDGVILHSDRRSQYGLAEFAGLCRRHGIRRSTGKVGSSYDNAAAESFLASLKRHFTLGHLSPVQFEQQIAAFRRITLVA